MTQRGASQALVIGLALAVLPGCGGSSPPDDSQGSGPPATDPPASDASFEAAACPFPIPPGQIEGATVRCGFLVVPEDRSAPAGRSIRLAVAVFQSPQASASDPVVYLSGGPGSSALEFLDLTFERTFAPMLAAGRELVLLDQRGVGYSQPALDCPRNAASLDEWLGCAAELRTRADLSAYHTAANAADVEALRRALGYDRVNLWAVSYGTRLALSLMRDYPSGLRSVVLDGVWPPDVDVVLDTAANTDAAIRHLFAECAADPACDAAWPNLEATWVSAVTRLDAAPARLTLTDPLTGAVFEGELDGADFVWVLFRFLYVTDLLPELPRMIHEAAVGRFDVIERYFGSFVGRALDANSAGMRFSVLCHDEIAFSSRAQYEAAASPFPLLRPAFDQTELGSLAYDVCDGWGAGRADSVENASVSSGVPTILLAGEYDPITPPSWAVRAGATLSNGRVFRFPAVGHLASHTPCGRQLAVDFFVDPQAGLDAGCIGGLRVGWSTFGATSGPPPPAAATFAAPLPPPIAGEGR